MRRLRKISRGKVHLEMNDLPALKSFFKSDVDFAVTNPIDLAGVALMAGTAYASCVGWRMTRFTLKTAGRCYRASRKAEPELRTGQRIKDTVGRLSGTGQEFKSEVGNALIDCIPFKDIFAGGDDDGEPPGTSGPEVP